MKTGKVFVNNLNTRFFFDFSGDKLKLLVEVDRRLHLCKSDARIKKNEKDKKFYHLTYRRDAAMLRLYIILHINTRKAIAQTADDFVINRVRPPRQIIGGDHLVILLA